MTASRRDESDDRVAPEEGARASELRAGRAPLDAPTVVSGQGSSTRRLVSPTTRETPSPHSGAVLVPPAGAVTTPAPVVQPAGSGSSLSKALPLPSPGDRIDVFVLEESIGVGGMGAVFRALDTRLDRHVALKILPPEQADDPEVSRRFQHEGRAAARLDHENIARVYTIGFDAGYYFIAFEFIEGETIRRRVEREGVLPPGEAINYTLQIAHALIHAVERGVVHRDIKPSNVLIDPAGRPRLADFGLAKRDAGEVTMTVDGQVLGTPAYMSPEQAAGDVQRVGPRSDVYSLGATLYCILTGRPAFDGPIGEVILAVRKGDFRPLRPLVPSIDPALEAICL
ncbi:MAG: serine/threonine protein kinase, partial [Planctomycetota bacterium]|nr:serine/threonine protein kinase [Planctomycetota bacterium]